MATTTKLVAADFGIRDGGDRAAVLNALLKANGKPVKAAALVKLARGHTTRRVARIANRIAIKAAVYKLGVKVVKEGEAADAVYKLVRK